MGAKKGVPPSRVVCTFCGEEKERSEFSVRLGTWKNVVSHCKACNRKKYGENAETVRKRAREYYWKNREKIAKRGRELRESNPARDMYYTAKRRARKMGVACTISMDDITIPERCPVFDIPLVVSKGSCSGNSPSLDRIDTTKGYTPENTIVVSHKANTMKSNANVDELRALVEFYEELQK